MVTPPHPLSDFPVDIPSLWEAFLIAEADTNGNSEVTLPEAYRYVEPLTDDSRPRWSGLEIEELGRARADTFIAQLTPQILVPARGPVTFMLAVDATDGVGPSPFLDQIGALAGCPVRRAFFGGALAKQSTVDSALDQLLDEVRSYDRVIVFLRGGSRQAEDGPVELADGLIIPLTLYKFFSKLKTQESLLILADKMCLDYERMLGTTTDLILVRPTMKEWPITALGRMASALDLPLADFNRDGRVDLNEAVWFANYTADGASNDSPVEVLQLLQLGNASHSVFSVPVKSGAANAPAGSAPTKTAPTPAATSAP